MMWVLLLCLAVVVHGKYVPEYVPGNFEKINLTTLNPNAVCNDGSPAVYFFRPGSGSGAGIYTIYLEGGGFCQDIASCQNRWNNTKHFMTSTQLPAVLNDTAWGMDVNHGGINSGNQTVNPNFYNANQAYLWYCSSDNHAGNTSVPFGQWQFRGKVIVQTLVLHLMKVQGMTQAKQILLTGFSAGAFGVFNNADFVGEMVSEFAPQAVFKAYGDSGWLQDVPDYHEYYEPSRAAILSLWTNFNARFDDSCEAVYAPAGEQWRCNFIVYTYPFISTPLFVAGYQFDSPFLNDVGYPFLNASTAEYAELLRSTFLVQSSALPAFFSPNCFCHGVEAFDARWNFVTVNGKTASTAVFEFLNGQDSRSVDSCHPIGCNPTCSCIYNPH